MTDYHSKALQELWDKAVIGVAEVGINGQWLRVNPTICSLLEYTQSELEDKTFQQVTHPDDVGDDMHMIQKLLQGELDHYVMTKRYITKTGRVVWIKLRVDPIFDDEGKVEFFLSQISPAISLDYSCEKPFEGRQIGITKTKEAPWVSFVKKEWKWLIASFIAGIGFYAKIYHETQVQDQRLQTLEELVKDLIQD